MRTLLCLCVLLAACGGRPLPDDGPLVVDGCSLPRAIPHAVQRVSQSRCVIEGRGDDGRDYAIDCDANSCVLRADGATRCRCTRRDWVNTCGNVALCVGWNQPLNFATMQYLRE